MPEYCSASADRPSAPRGGVLAHVLSWLLPGLVGLAVSAVVSSIPGSDHDPGGGKRYAALGRPGDLTMIPGQGASGMPRSFGVDPSRPERHIKHPKQTGDG